MPIKPVTKKISQASKELKDSKKVVKNAVATVAKSPKKRTDRKLPVANLMSKMQDLTKQIMT